MKRRTFLQLLAGIAAAMGFGEASGKPEIGITGNMQPVVLNDGWKATVGGLVKFNEGDTVLCPGCGDRIATALRIINSDEIVVSSAWKFHQPHQAGDSFKCKTCEAKYARGFMGGLQLHTDRGWL